MKLLNTACAASRVCLQRRGSEATIRFHTWKFIFVFLFCFFLFSIDIIIICLGSSDSAGAEWGEEGEDLLPQG